MSTPRVTICLPTIGRTEYLAGALQSLGGQTFDDYEVLILDNASGEEAQQIIARFVAATPAARVLRVEERLPMFANFNRGIDAARGTYVVFFNDDDEYQPDFLAHHVAVLDANPRIGFVGGNFDVIDGAGAVTARHRSIERAGSWDCRYFIDRLYRRGRTDFPTPGLVHRRAALAATRWDERLPMNWGDFAVLMRIAEQWDVGVVPDVLYAWRNHGQNSSSLPLSRTLRIRQGVLRNYCHEYAERYPEQVSFVAQLERHMAADLRRSLVWGWMSAPDVVEAGACRDFLAETHPHSARVLWALERMGLTVERRKAAAPVARAMARRMNA